jgi:RNA polymerase sigma-70 factor (ECF subfamily)
LKEKQLSEEALVQQLIEGSEAAFEALYFQYATKLAAFVTPYANSKEDVEEAVQETFLAVWLNRSNIDPNQSFSAYLFTIAKNFALKIIRKNIQQTLLEQNLSLLQTSKGTDQPDKTLLASELENELNQLVEQLPQRARQVFLLRRMEGLTNKEIAEKLDISISTVENHINVALRHIRQGLSLSELPLLFLAMALLA